MDEVSVKLQRSENHQGYWLTLETDKKTTTILVPDNPLPEEKDIYYTIKEKAYDDAPKATALLDDAVSARLD